MISSLAGEVVGQGWFMDYRAIIHAYGSDSNFHIYGPIRETKIMVYDDGY